MYYGRQNPCPQGAYLEAERASMSGMGSLGQIVPGVRTETIRNIIYASLGVVAASAIVFFIVKRPGRGQPNVR